MMQSGNVKIVESSGKYLRSLIQQGKIDEKDKVSEHCRVKKCIQRARRAIMLKGRRSEGNQMRKILENVKLTDNDNKKEVEEWSARTGKEGLTMRNFAKIK